MQLIFLSALFIEYYWKIVKKGLPGVNLTPNHTDIGMQPWWITCNIDTWSFFFLNTKKIYKDDDQWINLEWGNKFLWDGVFDLFQSIIFTYRVHEFRKFGEIIPPTSVHHLRFEKYRLDNHFNVALDTNMVKDTNPWRYSVIFYILFF